MVDFDDFYNDKMLNEDAAQVAASVLGFSSVALLSAFGGSLLIYGGIKAVDKLVRFWKKIIKTAKNIGKEDIYQIKQEPEVKHEKVKIDIARRKYEDELFNVYSAIEEKDWQKAKEEFNKLPRELQNLPDIHKAIIGEIVKVMGEPPLYVKSPGNKTYQAIKKVLNIKIARAAATATELKMKEIGVNGET